jgi:hypothetical protein
MKIVIHTDLLVFDVMLSVAHVCFNKLVNTYSENDIQVPQFRLNIVFFILGKFYLSTLTYFMFILII